MSPAIAAIERETTSHVRSREPRAAKVPAAKRRESPGRNGRYHESGLAEDDEKEEQVGPDAVIPDDSAEISVEMHDDIERVLLEFDEVWISLHASALMLVTLLLRQVAQVSDPCRSSSHTFLLLSRALLIVSGSM